METDRPMKYIDAEKLIAEIKRRRTDAILYDMSGGDAPVYDEMLSIVDSLQQEHQEMNLEKEIDEWLKHGHITDTRYSDYCDDDIKETARHFYELGKLSNKK